MSMRGIQQWRTIAALLAAIACAACAAAQGQTPPEEERWGKDIQAFEKQDHAEAPPQNAILFVGSSTIRGWDLKKYFPDLDTINRGFGGSQISDSLFFANRIIIPYKPRIIVFYAGDNDIASGKSPEQVKDDFKDLVEAVHAGLPSTRFVFLSIKPSIARWSLAEKMRRANDLIREFADQNNKVDFVDMQPIMLGEDGKPKPEFLVEDGLHLSPAGYDAWSAALKPYLVESDDNPGSPAATVKKEK